MPNRYDDDLSMLQETNLIQESDSAKHLAAYGVRTLRTAAFIETTRDPIMTMLSIGVEKLLKLSLGLLHVEAQRVWIPARVLKNEYRHDLIKMEELLRDAIRQNAVRATHRYWVDEALAALDNDPVWPFVVAALNRYGQEGRFFHLDALADNPQREESPQVFWDAAEAAALDSDPELKDLWQRMLQDYSLSDEFYRRLNERIADSLQRWLDLVSMASIQGVLGERGKAWGHDIKNVGRQILED
ncbi:hypothetical protein HMPREF1529_03017 [Microbacterium sp. oral taxon 186 str. F0373]|uniref:hypothetical protein n=1 Tax=Microbacterium sp. oral taxon 186 TaxID=712383 RepID=UPI00034E0A04|nr:hypothetical protein [Microbacterium sp. oral taxon 186]EPD83635.1 hypothetical protein HMPREF1529_03017 [Microbacterium sp. oral taxon 186 str. F0373]